MSKNFKKILEEKLGPLYGRAEIIFDNYGEKLSFDVANVLMHAVDKSVDTVKEVLNLLEKHFEKHLAFQHPDVKGEICNSFGVNETQVMFLSICEKTLGLKNQEIPQGSFVAKTRNSTYRFKENEKGERAVSRDKKPLDFSRCKITKLIVGSSMVLERLDDSGFEWVTSAIISIEAS